MFSLSSPVELYSLTLRNLSRVSEICRGGEGAKVVHEAVDTMRKVSKNLTFIQYNGIRNSILSALEEKKTKIIPFT